MYATATYTLYKLFCCRHVNEEVARFRPCFVPKLDYFRSSTIMILINEHLHIIPPLLEKQDIY